MTRLRLDAGDARRLLAYLARVAEEGPAGPEGEPAVTLEGLVPPMIVRPPASARGPARGLILGRSRICGPPARVATACTALAHAVRLGCREIALTGPEVPLAGRSDRCLYSWPALPPETPPGPVDAPSWPVTPPGGSDRAEGAFPMMIPFDPGGRAGGTSPATDKPVHPSGTPLRGTSADLPTTRDPAVLAHKDPARGPSPPGGGGVAGLRC